MTQHSLTLTTCICSLLIGLQVQIPSCSSSVAKSVDSGNLPAQQPIPLSSERLCALARSITVTIMSADGKSSGSGFLIHKKLDGKSFLYKVVTNGHVLTRAKDYKIQAPDGAVYPAIVISRFDENNLGDDLAVLQFATPKNNYAIAKLAAGLTLSSARGDKVVAAGFPLRTGPSQSSQFVCTPLGEVSLVLAQPMKRGYQLGYSLDIKKGMSGGPLLNLQGEVVGVNGKHSNPLWGGDSLFAGKDGSPVSEFQESRDLMIRSSWAIPMETVVPLAISRGIPIALRGTPAIPTQTPAAVSPPPTPNPPSQTTDPKKSPAPPPTPPSAVPPQQQIQASASSQQSPSVLEQLARNITVKVRIGKELRSGILIRRKGDTYTVLTYEGKLEAGYYNIETYDGKRYPTHPPKKLSQSDGNRLVELDFYSSENYQTASLGDSNSLAVGGEVFAAGFLYATDSSQPEKFEFRNGRIEEKRGEGYGVLRLKISNNVDANNVDEGMIGGPLLNSQGEVVGINGRQKYPTEEKELSYNWGIPIEVYTKKTAANSRPPLRN